MSKGPDFLDSSWEMPPFSTMPKGKPREKSQGYLLSLHGPSLPASSAFISARNGDASLG